MAQVDSSDQGQKLDEERFPILTYAQLISKIFPGARWTVEALVLSPGVTIFSADPYNYKSWLMLHMAMCICLGDPVFGRFEVEQSPVMIIDEEDPPRVLQDRLKMLQPDHEKHPFELYFMSLANFIFSEENIAFLLAECRALGVKVIIFDSFIRVSGVDNENDAVAINKALGFLKPLTAEGITTLITHHHNKRATEEDLSKAIRGSSDIRASIEGHIAIAATEDGTIRLVPTKARGSVLYPPFEVNIDSDGSEYMKFTYNGTTNKSPLKRDEAKQAILATLSTSEAPMFQAQIFNTIKELGCDTGRRTFENVIRRMAQKGEVIRTKGTGNKHYYSLPPDQINDS